MDQKARNIRTLINSLNMHTELYDAGKPIISDKEWDNMYFQLVDLEKKTGIIFPDSPTQTVHYKNVSNLGKVYHENPLLSLEKTKDVKEISSFVKGQDWMAMFKMDGLTLSLTYVNGELVKAATRGNGEVGEDVTHNALVIPSIPKKIPVKETIEVDGEIICKKNDFKKFERVYKNPRNFASGGIRLQDAKECASRNLTFVAWDLREGFKDIDFFFWRLEKLDELGFITVPRIGDAETVSDAMKWLDKAQKDKVYKNYPIDGYVFRFESQKYYNMLGRTEHHFRGAMAFKFHDDEYETELLDIELSIGRTGILTPVAVFKPIDMDGSVVERASLHNLSVMRDTVGIHPYRNQKIKVVKMNMIIPQITWADTNEENVDWDNLIKLTSCPVCGGGLEVKNNNGVLTLWCANSDCEGKLLNRIDHFCGKKGLDIKGISKATIEKLMNWGWINELGDIFKLDKHRVEWISKAGFGEASVGKVLSAIDNARNVSLQSFISAIGIPLVGNTVSKEIVKYYSTWEDFRNAVGGDWTEFEGFGPEISKAINNFDYTEADKIAGMLTFKQPKVQTSTNKSLEGKTYCVTGKLTSGKWKNRDELKAYIQSLGGKVVGSMSANVDYLINNDATSGSAKNVSAKKLGIPIITEEEFIKSLG